MNLALRFLGVGTAQAVELGSSNAVLERDSSPLLMIDCGPDGLTAYRAHYGTLPDAVFITHAHLDHVGGLERLFYASYFDLQRRGRVRLYVPANLVPVLQARLASYPDAIAEGGANFWDSFQLVPVGRGFWHRELWFDVFAVRHHAPGTAFGIALHGAVIWTGDTRPIPEILEHYGTGAELVAHDCGLIPSPSHTGLADLEREYSVSLRERLLLYHYPSEDAAMEMRRLGYRTASPGQCIELPAHERPVHAGHG
jgi:ribonuclease BN (tRNA processing enzyme)